MTQWASAFTESALGVSKTVGDLAGPCMFAVFMGVARVFYGKKSEAVDLTRVMLFCGSLCIACYAVAALSRLDGRTYRLRSLWLGCGNYVAGNH